MLIWESSAHTVVKFSQCLGISEGREKRAEARTKVVLLFKEKRKGLTMRTKRPSSGKQEENPKRVVLLGRGSKETPVSQEGSGGLKHMHWLGRPSALVCEFRPAGLSCGRMTL